MIVLVDVLINKKKKNPPYISDQSPDIQKNPVPINVLEGRLAGTFFGSNGTSSVTKQNPATRSNSQPQVPPYYDPNNKAP
ncbi:hypothetical protein ACTXT7_005202 [Hymenolepis weldensis]